MVREFCTMVQACCVDGVGPFNVPSSSAPLVLFLGFRYQLIHTSLHTHIVFKQTWHSYTLACTHTWPSHTRYPSHTSGLNTHVAFTHTLPSHTSGLNTHVAFTHTWPSHTSGLNTHVAFTLSWPLLKHGLYTNVNLHVALIHM